MIIRFYRKPALSESMISKIINNFRIDFIRDLKLITEWCFYVEIKNGSKLTFTELEKLKWLLSETFEEDYFSQTSNLDDCKTVLEIGPRLNFETAWSSSAVSICHSCGLDKVVRLEKSRRFGFSVELNQNEQSDFLSKYCDRMTETEYSKPLENFESGAIIEPVQIVPVMGQGEAALTAINKQLGLSMDLQDLQIYLDLFVSFLQRDTNNVEMGQLGNSNSEHSRHGFFTGRFYIDGKKMPHSLMYIIKKPWKVNPGNSNVAFGDDSSAINGKIVRTILPSTPGLVSNFIQVIRTYHPILSVETHNHPTGVEPYQGAATGIGGWLRDILAMRLGGLVIAANAGYCTGNLHILGYDLPWENDGWEYPPNLASPLDIMIQASNGASDYGNCYGVPVIYGYARTFGIDLPDGYRSWFKPLMLAGGIGQYDDAHSKVGKPKKDMLVVQVGGPAYRIGVGGGAASSMISGENEAELDFASVQRGNAQMENRLARVIQTFVNLGDDNPVELVVDLGAGGDCNAVPELVNPAGAVIDLRSIPVGDATLSDYEIHCNESQERIVFLIRSDRFDQVKEICDREDAPCALIGQVTGDGLFILFDKNDGTTPVNLPLDKVLGKLPRKTFKLETILPTLKPLELPQDLTVASALDLVLRLVSVGSKRFLTTKVDRSVTGLIAQQQCVGPNHITLADCAVVAQSHFDISGIASSIGEQPNKGLISPEAAARLSVSEMLLNISGTKITQLEDIKCSGNWMLAAKEPGEGAWLYKAACAVRDIMIKLGIAIDGGKDSLSMAAKTKGPDGNTHIVKAPPELVITGYATVDDITCKVTPDFKKPGSEIIFIDLSGGKDRLGGSALAQVFQQIGDESPDIDDVELLKLSFNVIQELVEKKLIFSLHDKSDGGLIVSLLEMAFAGNVGVDVNLLSNNIIQTLFNEEAGILIECSDYNKVVKILREYDIPYLLIGHVGKRGGQVNINHDGGSVLSKPMVELRAIWETTSMELDKLQTNPACVQSEFDLNLTRIAPPPYSVTFTPEKTSQYIIESNEKPKVAILRERGSNGDKEMASAFFMAGFEVWDVTMHDLLNNKITLDVFQGIAFVGGFSFADVMDAGKGWAGVIKFNDHLMDQFDRFYKRPDTFSFGICNGCQLMALLGWIPHQNIDLDNQPRFIRNISERFESRFSTIIIEDSPSIMLKGMSGSKLGVWVAHGEGRYHCKSDSITNYILDNKLAPIRFIDNDSNITEIYPDNPNGSPMGIAALCSPDGRHLAMMPHPERVFLPWQWPWMPEEFSDFDASPWLLPFQNAYRWCIENKE
ncbi:MAG: phosphoribosylformylglycinamidine synthase [Candidatus Kerfeldbacteria bacterium]